MKPSLQAAAGCRASAALGRGLIFDSDSSSAPSHHTPSLSSNTPKDISNLLVNTFLEVNVDANQPSPQLITSVCVSGGPECFLQKKPPTQPSNGNKNNGGQGALICDVTGKCKFKPTKTLIDGITEFDFSDNSEFEKKNASDISKVPVVKGVADDKKNGDDDGDFNETGKKNKTITMVPIVPGLKDTTEQPWYPKPYRPPPQDLRPLVDFYLFESYPAEYPSGDHPPRPVQPQPQYPYNNIPLQYGSSNPPNQHHLQPPKHYPLPYGPHMHRPTYNHPPKNANRPTTIICCTSQNARPTYDVLNEIASNLGANGIQELIYQQTWQPRPPSFLPVDQGGPWSHQRPTNFMPPPQRWPPPTTTPCPPKSPWDGNGNNGALVKKVKAKSDVAQILKDAEEIKIETPQVNARGRFSITFG